VRLHFSGGCYKDVEALTAHYGKNKLVYRHHTKHLGFMTPILEDHNSLVLLKHNLTHHLGGMIACHGDSFEQFVTFMADHIFPKLLLLSGQNTILICLKVLHCLISSNSSTDASQQLRL